MSSQADTRERNSLYKAFDYLQVEMKRRPMPSTVQYATRPMNIVRPLCTLHRLNTLVYRCDASGQVLPALPRYNKAGKKLSS